MAIRRFANQTNFAAGEVSEQFWNRFDLDIAGKAARSLRNKLVTQNASAKTRPGFSKRAEWRTDWRFGGENNFRIFPFVSNVGTEFASISTDQHAQDFGLILYRNPDDGDEVLVAKFDPTQINVVEVISAPIPADDTSILAQPGGVIAAAQALTTMFFVSDLFHPHKFVEDAVADSESGEVKSIQFYKDIGAFVAIDETGLATFNTLADGSGDAVEPTEHFKLGLSNAKFIRVLADEYEITNFPLPGQAQLSGWSNGNVSGLIVQRRWPNKFEATNGPNTVLVDDKMGTGDDDADDFVSFFRPTCVAFFQSRLWLASSIPISSIVGGRFPSRLWVSRDSDPYVISHADAYPFGVVPADAPIAVDLSVEDGDRLQWAKTADRLYFGGTRATYVMVSGTGTDAIDASKLVGLKKINGLGTAANVPPIQRNGQPVYVTRDAAAIVWSRFNFDTQAFSTDDAGRYARHLTTGVTRLALRPPNPQDAIERLYVAKSDGSVAQAAFTDLFDYPAWAPLALPAGVVVDDLVTLEGRTFMVCRATIPAGVSHAIVRLDDDEPDIALDFLSTAVGGPTIWTTGEPYLFSKVAYAWIFQHAAHGWVLLGPVNIDGEGVFTINSYTDLTPPSGPPFIYGVEAVAVKVGIPVSSTMVPMPAYGDDERGSSNNRRHRLISASVRVRDTREFLIEGQPMILDLPPNHGTHRQEIARHSGVYLCRLGGYSDDPTVTIDNLAAHRLEVVSLTTEVAT